MSKVLFSPDVLAVWLPVTLTAIGALVRLIFKDKADRYRSVFSEAVQVAYSGVNEFFRLHPDNGTVSKVQMGLDIVKQYLDTHGLKVDAMGTQRAAMMFSALSAKENATKAVAASAGSAAVPH
jgi:hypothetical protein